MYLVGDVGSMFKLNDLSGKGFVTYKGLTLWSSSTSYGDGYFSVDNSSLKVFSDSATIGCAPIECLEGEHILGYGLVLVKFKRPFTCSTNDGLVKIGYLQIDTRKDC